MWGLENTFVVVNRCMLLHIIQLTYCFLWLVSWCHVNEWWTTVKTNNGKRNTFSNARCNILCSQFISIPFPIFLFFFWLTDHFLDIIKLHQKTSTILVLSDVFLSIFFLLKAKEQTYFDNSVTSLPLLNITFYGDNDSVILGLWFSSFSSSFHSEWHMDSRKAEARGGKEWEGPSWPLLRWLSSYLGSWCT